MNKKQQLLEIKAALIHYGCHLFSFQDTDLLVKLIDKELEKIDD